MKTLLATVAALGSLTAAAYAADIPIRRAPPPYVAAPVFTWTGFYVGVNAGYGTSMRSDASSTTINTVDPRVLQFGSGLVAPNLTGFGDYGIFNFASRGQRDGFAGGGQIGYNYQFTPGSGFVIGAETDAQYLDIGKRRTASNACFGVTLLNVFGPCGAPGVTSFGGLSPGATVFNPFGEPARLDYIGTVRGRLGYAFDRLLVYGTGGFAYGIGDQRGPGAVKNDSVRTGYTVGGGIEYALPTDSFLNFFSASAITVKIEALYVNLDNNGNKNGTAGVFANTPNGPVLAVPAGTTLTPGGIQSSFVTTQRQRDTEFAIVRAGLNYKFGTY